MRSDFWLCNTSCHLLIPWLTLVRTRVGLEEQSWWRHYPGIHRASLKGCNVLWDCRLGRLYLPPPWRPPQCGYPVQLEILCWKQTLHMAEKHRGLLKGQLSVSPLINYWGSSSSQSNGSHLCCHRHANQLSALVQWGFCASERCNCVVLICLSLQQVTTSKEPPKQMLLFFSAIIWLL